MGCGCRGGNRSAAKAAGGGTFVFQVVLPGEAEPRTYLTALEAKREIRRAGGGTVRRVPQQEG